jgi:hypothetical protein
MLVTGRPQQLRRSMVEDPIVRKQIRLIIMSRNGNRAARVNLLATVSGVQAKAVVEEHEPLLIYETAQHPDERSALADVASWLRSRCNASMTCLATDGVSVVLITGDPSLRLREGRPCDAA